MPYGRYYSQLRAALARHLLAGCGRNVNVERGADFGAGYGVSLGDNSGLGVDCLVIGPVTIGANVMMGP